MLNRLKLDEARLHRATYVGILNQCLSQRGSKQALAEQVGITPQHLSYLLVLDDDPDDLRTEIRTPSPALAKRIAETVDIEESDRAQLLAHMLAAGSRDSRPQAEVKETSDSVSRLVPIITSFWGKIRSSPYPGEVSTLLEAVLGMGAIVSKCLDPEEERIETAELHLNLARVERVRARPREALYHAYHADLTPILLPLPILDQSRDRRPWDSLRRRRTVAQGTVRPDLIVLSPPALDQNPGFGQSVEEFAV